MSISTTFAWTLGATAFALGSFAAGTQINLARPQVVQTQIIKAPATPSVETSAMLDASVSIRTISHVTTDRFGDTVWSTGSGSGFLVSKAGCEVWTSHHVVTDAAIVEVFPRGWKGAHGIPARVVNGTPREDVAILSMERCDGLSTAKLGRSDTLTPGDETYAVGNPLGTNPDSISRGIISHTARYVDGTTAYLQTDAAISPGNSGGALFDRDGAVIGINNAVAATQNGGAIGIGYAIPIDVVKRVVDALKQGPPSWGDAGLMGLLTPLSPEEAAVFGVPNGSSAVSMIGNPITGPAADKLQERDVIYQIDGENITDVAGAFRQIARRRPGELSEIRFMRGGVTLVTNLEVTDGWKKASPLPPQPYEGHLGMTLEMWDETSPIAQPFAHPVITQISSLGPAHRSLIASSQRAAALRGPIAETIQYDVKAVSGVVFKGAYQMVASVEYLSELAATAFAQKAPLLLEIQHWARSDPQRVETPLSYQGTAFYRVLPAPAALDDPRSPDDDQGLVAQAAR